MRRFVTWIDQTDNFGMNDDTVNVATENQYKLSPEIQRAVADSSEYVWQFADTAEAAQSQHFDKHELWEINPDLRTY